MPSKGDAPAARPAVTAAEYALFCWLRLHPNVAKTYHIEDCNGATSIGSMLLQLLQALGMDVRWYDRMDEEPKGRANQKAAAWIKSVSVRPGRHMQTLAELPKVAPPSTAAVLRKGKLPKVCFPLLKVKHKKRPRHTNSRGNRRAAPADVMLMERQRLVDFVESKVRCEKCSTRLRFHARLSHQVAACAQLCFVCEKSHVLTLHSSAPMHSDDYELNSKLNYNIVTCALSFDRMVPFLTRLGMRAPSNRDHYQLKSELEPILADMSERSMAEAHERAIKAKQTDFFSVDMGFTAPRNAHGGTMPAHVEDGSIVELVHMRLTDAGAKHSKGLEKLAYEKLLTSPRLSIYGTVVMDGCQELVAPTHASNRRGQGDLWHFGKNHSKWMELALGLLCRKPPGEADASPNPRVEKVVIEASRIETLGERPPKTSVVEHASKRIRDLGGEPEDGANTAQLKKQFGELARAAAMTDRERAQEEHRQRYLEGERRRKAAGSERNANKKVVAAARTEAMAWRRDIRSMLRYVAMYTKGLRGQTNPDSPTGSEWTDEERGAEFRRCWRSGCVALILGRRNDETLKLLKHPLTEVDREPSRQWVPPGKGFVVRDGFLFKILYSIIHDPVWDNKFPALIDCLMTYVNESFFHVLRKWGTKHSHFHRYYTIAIWCALLDWNENVTRPVLEKQYVKSKSGQLASSAGRGYTIAIRVPKTDFWRGDGWQGYQKWARTGRFEPTTADRHAPSYLMVPKGEQRPERVRSAAPIATAATVAARPIGEMSVDELKAELASNGLPDKGKKAVLAKSVQDAREDLEAVQQARAPKLALRVLPEPTIGGRAGSSPRRGQRRTDDPVEDCVPILPDFGLPGPYFLPADQWQQRKSVPGQRKYTAVQIECAKAAGKDHMPIKRVKVAVDAAAGPSNAAAEEEEEDDDESEEEEYESDADGESEADSE